MRTCWVLYCWLVSSVMGGMDDVRNDREALFLVPCELNVYVGCGLTARSEVDFLRGGVIICFHIFSV